AEMVNRAAPLAAEHARGMRVVHHHDRAISFCEIAQPRQRANITIHRKNAVGDQQLAAWLALNAGELLFGMRNIFVAEDKNLRPRQPAAVNDRSVVQLVGDDEVFLTKNGGNGARVGRESGLEDDAGFDVLEARNLLFEVHVDAHGAGNRSHRARSDAEFACSLKRRLAQLGMRRQPKVIVRSKIDDLLAVKRADRSLLILQHAQLEVRTLGLEFIELIGKKGERIGAGGSRHESYLGSGIETY